MRVLVSRPGRDRPDLGRGGLVKERIWTFVDKRKWGPGPWMDEPDKIQYPDPETGLPCLAVRGPLGSWCGYVGKREFERLIELVTNLFDEAEFLYDALQEAREERAKEDKS
jgi:hypothetical protein